jgi:hypothetical protein
MTEIIKYKDNTLAIIIRANFKFNGIKFFTPTDFSQQLGYMNRPKNYVIEPHLHNTVDRNVKLMKEVLYIKSGKVRVDFYDDKKNYVESRILHQGDVILLATGGHGFKMIDPSEIIEVKQGPYVEDKDKIRFKSVDDEKIQLK